MGAAGGAALRIWNVYAVKFNPRANASSGVLGKAGTGAAFATGAGCTAQTAACLRGLTLAQVGLIRSAYAGAWVITSLGQLRLKNLRSTLEFFGR